MARTSDPNRHRQPGGIGRCYNLELSGFGAAARSQRRPAATVTATAGAGIYLSRGYIDPGLVMLGVLAGSRELAGAKVRVLRIVFAVVIGALATEMIHSGLTGKI